MQQAALEMATKPLSITQDTFMAGDNSISQQTLTGGWREAFLQVLPLYFGLHVAFLLLTYLAVLFSLDNFSRHRFPLITLLHSWNRWDSSIYTSIATTGYSSFSHMAFFLLVFWLLQWLTGGWIV